MRLLAADVRLARGRRPAAPGASSFATAFTLRVGASADDAIEVISTGAVTLTDAGLNLGKQDTTNYPVLTGARFTSVPIAAGQDVGLARLRFVARSANSPEFVVRIRAQAHDSAPAFTTATSDISGRTLTTAYVDWSVPEWGVNQDDAGTLSPDLSAVVTEVITRVGWVSGNAIVFVLTAAPSDPDASRRRPYSYDGSSTLAPRFTVNTGETEPPSPPGGTGDFSDGVELFGLLGRNTGTGAGEFDPASPTLKDGMSITGDMLAYHTAMHGWRTNANKDAGADLYSIFSSTEASTKARVGQTIQDTCMRMFRLTGDFRWLDYLCYGYARLVDAGNANRMTVAFKNPDQAKIEASSVYSWCGGTPNSPYDKVLTFQYTDATYGTDWVNLEQAKFWAIVAEFAVALEVNRGKTSPGGYNYGTLADAWGARVRNAVLSWSQSTTGACWEGNYRGVDGTGGAVTNTGSSKFRQTAGLYPFFLRDEGHSGMNSIMLNYYVGRLGLLVPSLGILNPADAITAAKHMASVMRGNYDACTTADYGADLVWTQSKPYTGGSTDPQRMTYTTHQCGTFTQMWLTGEFRGTWPASDMVKLGRRLAYAHDGTTGLTHENIVRVTASCGMAAGSGTKQSASNNSLRGFAVLPIVWDPGGTKMADIATALISLSGGMTTPDRAAIHSAGFLREALTAVGDID